MAVNSLRAVFRRRLAHRGNRARAGLYSGGALLIGALLYAGFGYRPPPSPGQLVSSALLLCQIHAFDKAQVDLRQALDQEPDYVDAKLLLAHTEQSLGRPLAAAQLYRDCLDRVEKDEQRADVLFRIAVNYLKSGRYWSAREHATQLQALLGPNVRAYVIAALSSYGVGDDKGFRDGITRAYELDPTSPALRWNIKGLLPARSRVRVYKGAVISMVESL